MVVVGKSIDPTSEMQGTMKDLTGFQNLSGLNGSVVICLLFSYHGRRVVPSDPFEPPPLPQRRRLSPTFYETRIP